MKLEEGDTILRLGNGAKVATHSISIITLVFHSNKFVLDPVYYVSSLIKNVISVSVLDSEGFEFSIKNGKLSAYKNGSLLAQGSLNNRPCYLEERPTLIQVQSNKRELDNQNDAYL